MEKKKMVIVMTMIIFIITANMNGVKSDASDCYDGCSTACVNPDPRLTSRCDRKCQIRCSPGIVPQYIYIYIF
ncbi:hypothetical protein BUALT_Bualt19G0090900 [Buddleja alternifolia]|uniref:Plant thionin family protein n=1 Tax=Buddleja alternifolia TaxID=168488 RepID=A0AAV6W227_9LAMI|nr:hypothetical protein BUALT_Bualt19G0090900 [Buddleja alternifolia]